MANLSTRQKNMLRGIFTDDALADLFIAMYDAADVLSATETGYIDGVTAGTSAASKALVLNSDGDLDAGPVILGDGNMVAGTGITTGTGTVCEHRVTRVGDLYKTEIFLDVTGLADDDATNDIIGKPDDVANCHIGRIVAAVNGTIVGGRVTCLEAPTTGDPDIDIWGSVTEATGAQGAGVATLTGEAQLINHGDWSAGDIAPLTAMPGANGYLYLTVGAATPDNGTYDAGIFLIELWGK
jgi:hypothetical protein